MISLIAAMSKNYVIGKDNQLPWHIPADLKHFKQLTLNKPIIMGRKTFESIGRPLPKRRNIVVSRQPNLVLPGCDVFTSIDDAIHAAQDAPEIMIIGGTTIFEQTLEKADRLYLTIVDIEIAGDAYFPRWSEAWHVIEEQHHEQDGLKFRFVTLINKRRVATP